jgi:predicted DNA-binding transcriptional regulator YafY
MLLLKGYTLFIYRKLTSESQAIRPHVKLTIGYEEAQGVATKRVIWPLFITCMEDVRIILA